MKYAFSLLLRIKTNYVKMLYFYEFWNLKDFQTSASEKVKYIYTLFLLLSTNKTTGH